MTEEEKERKRVNGESTDIERLKMITRCRNAERNKDEENRKTK
jgi:hypothetical protein